MIRAVIFDWYGTLAEWQDPDDSSYATVFANFGYAMSQQTFEHYHARWDGVDHQAHSVDQEAYTTWTRARLCELALDCNVDAGDVDQVVEALLEADSAGPMALFPEVIPTLQALHQRDLLVAVCSNWGWNLRSCLETTGAAPLADVVVTSAKAGFRKPHPGIYEHTLTLLGIPADEAVFVGDSWGPDVEGPSAVGITAVHVVRDQQANRALHPWPRRISSLDELLSSRILETTDSSGG